MVVELCPDIVDYARGGAYAPLRDLVSTASIVRPMLGISPSAWEEACAAMGDSQASTGANRHPATRRRHQKDPEGYLRILARRAAAGEFSDVTYLLMALRRRRRAASETRTASHLPFPDDCS